MNGLRTLKIIFTHPLTKKNKIKSIKRYLLWHLSQLINPYPIIFPFVNQSKLIVQSDMSGAVVNVYVGLQEFHEMCFLLHFLRKKDLFVDIGANIGSYTILSAAVKKAKTIAVEPIPSAFNHLQNNIYLNNLQNLVISYNIGLAKENSKKRFTSNLDSMNHVTTENENLDKSIEVTVKKLDDLIYNENPILIKIDVEGYETEVLAGAKRTLSNEKLKAVIIELNGLGKKYGFNDEELHNLFLEYNFRPYNYFPFERRLEKAHSYNKFNTIYIRDLKLVEDRIKNAPNISVLGQYL